MIGTNNRAGEAEFVGGTALNEREIRARIIEALGDLVSLLRGMAALRKDIRYLAMGGIIEEMRDKFMRVFEAPASSVPRLPPRQV